MTELAFEQMMRLIHVLKQHAMHRNDRVLWGKADEIYWRLLRVPANRD